MLHNEALSLKRKKKIHLIRFIYEKQKKMFFACLQSLHSDLTNKFRFLGNGCEW